MTNLQDRTIVKGATVRTESDTGVSVRERVAAVRHGLAGSAVDLLVLPPGEDFLYLFGYTPHLDERACYLFLTKGDSIFLVPELNAAEARQHVPFEALLFSDADGPASALDQARGRLGKPRRIAVGDTMRADALLRLQETWPESLYTSGGEIMVPLRMIKSPQEVAALRRSAATADAAIEAVFRAARPGLTEIDLARTAREAFNDQGVAEVPSAIIGSGPNSAFPHHSSSTRRLQPGEVLLADAGGRLDGYMSDITRMAFLGPPTSRYRQIHAVVEEAVAAGIDAVRPGLPIREVDRAARSTIERAGFGEHFVHRTGHGIGVSGHELPSITHTNEMPLAVGMTFSVEPGIYFVGEFGVRLEEIVVVTERGGERLSRLPREVWIAG